MFRFRICSIADLESEEIDRLQRETRKLNRRLAQADAELHGMRKGGDLVAAQLANDIRRGAIREEQQRVNAARAYQDLQRALRLVAGHVLDMRGSAQEPETVEACELLVDEFAATGIPLRPALLAIEVERAEAGARVTAAEAAAAIVVTNAPAPQPAPAAN